MASDIGNEAKQTVRYFSSKSYADDLQRQLDALQRRHEVAIKTLLLIRDTHVGMQSVSWYSELAARALAEIKAMEDVT